MLLDCESSWKRSVVFLSPQENLSAPRYSSQVNGDMGRELRWETGVPLVPGHCL